ncbi:hypothetical protein RUM44_005225 [Polyplax serrata]|uniref:Uncharacterized protein n=1 Tax=Polyplax serrata TaxID=468196 RepID=A0ABR1AED7_POLSC
MDSSTVSGNYTGNREMDENNQLERSPDEQQERRKRQGEPKGQWGFWPVIGRDTADTTRSILWSCIYQGISASVTNTPPSKGYPPGAVTSLRFRNPITDNALTIHLGLETNITSSPLFTLRCAIPERAVELMIDQ